jgi:hypothetical protein
VLREKLDKKRILLNDDQRLRLAAAGKCDPTPSMWTEIVPRYQLQPSKTGAVAGHPNYLTLREARFTNGNKQPG